MICNTIPTNGIHPTTEVTIPKILPCLFSFSLEEKIKVIICKIAITIRGVQANPRIMLPPNTGIPSNASKPPLIHLSILDILIINTYSHDIKKILPQHYPIFNKTPIVLCLLKTDTHSLRLGSIDE